MKKLLFVLFHPLTLCAIGSAIVFGGEMWGAEDSQPGDTISEWFMRQPLWVKLLIFWCIGAVCAHLAQWQISPPVTVNADSIENVNVESEAAPKSS